MFISMSEPTMQRYRLFRRGWGTFYAFDNITCDLYAPDHFSNLVYHHHPKRVAATATERHNYGNKSR